MADDSKTSLQIEVISTGISDASDNLDTLAVKADVTERSVSKLTDTISQLSSVFSSNLASAKAYTSAISDMSGVLANSAASGASRMAQAESDGWSTRLQQAESFYAQYDAQLEASIEREQAAYINAQQKMSDILQTSLDKEVSTYTKARQRELDLDNKYYNATLAAKRKTIEQIMTLNAMGNSKEDLAKQFGQYAVSQATTDGLKGIVTQLEAGKLAAHEFSLANAGVVREMMVMGHEAMTGNFSRIPGSLMVMANRSGGLFALLESIGVGGVAAYAGIAAAIGSVVVATVMAIDAQDKFNKAMQLTGNFAGVTMSGIDEMAASIQGGMTGGLSKAKDMLTALASTGHFTGDELKYVGQAALDYQHLTGKSTEEVVQYFDQMKNGVGKWSEDAMKNYHVVDDAQMTHIRNLDEQGKATEAVIEISKAFHNSMDTTAEKAGYVSKAFMGWGLLLGKIKDGFVSLGTAIANWGATQDKVAQAMAQTQKVNDLAQQLQGMGQLDPARQRIKDELTQAIKDQAKLSQEAADEQRAIATKSENDQIALAKNTAQKLLEEEEKKNASMKQQRESYATWVKQQQTIVNGSDKTPRSEGYFSDQHAQKLIDDFNAKHQDPKKATDDPSKQILETQLADVKNSLDAQLEVYKTDIAGINEQEKNRVIGAYAAYTERKAVYAQEIAAIEDSYAQRLKIMDSYHAKTETEKAQRQKERNQMVADEQKQVKQIQDAMKIDLANTNDKSNKHIDSLLGDADKIRASADAMEAFGKSAKATNIQTEAIAVSQDKMDTLFQSGAIASRMYAAAEKDRAQAYYDMASVMAKVSEEQEALETASVEGVAGAETQKVARWQESTQKVVEFAKIRETAAINEELLLGKITYAEYFKRMDDLNSRYNKTTDAVNKLAKTKFEVAGLKDTATQFDTIGNSLSKMGGSFATVGKSVKEVGAAFKELSDAQQKQDSDAASSTASQLGAYGNMTTAAQGFFDTNSSGYKILQATSAAFHAWELAIELESMIKKLFFSNTVTATKVANATVGAAADTTEAGVSIAADGAKATASGIAAYAKSMASLPFPLNIAAGAATIAALLAVGVKMTGGSGTASVDSNSAQEVQKTQGTGTVLGDSTAQSKSIENALTDIKNNSAVSITYYSQMTSSLNSIADSMSGLASLVSRIPGVTDGSNMGIETGKSFGGGAVGNAVGNFVSNLPIVGGALGKIAGAIFGSSSSSVTDSGLLVNGSLNQLASGQGVQQYANVHTDSSGFLGLSHSSSDDLRTQGVSAEVAQQFGLVFKNLESSLVTVGTTLGENVSDIQNRLNMANIDIGKISLEGLTGTALTDAINAAISAAADKLAATVLPGISDFTKVGEGMYQTAVRVADGIQTADYALKPLGVTAINYQQIIDKQGDVATEIVRQSLEAKAAGTVIVGILQGFSGTAADLVTEYRKLVDIQSTMDTLGIGSKNLTTTLIDAAGGIDALQSALNTMTQDFLSSSQNLSTGLAKMQQSFANIGVTMPATRAEFASMVEGLMQMGTAGQQTAGEMLQLATSYDDFEKSVDSAISTATTNLNDAYTAQAKTITDTQTAFKNFTTSLQSFHDSLLTGSLSPLTNVDKYAQAKAQYESTLSAAEGGDQTAISNFQSVAQTFLQASQAVNASGSGYSTDFNSVATATQALADYSNQQVSVAQQQLDALNAQVNGLITVNQSVLTVADAIQQLNDILVAGGRTGSSATSTLGITAKPSVGPSVVNTAAATSQPYIVGTSAATDSTIISSVASSFANFVNGSHANGLDYVPFDGYIAQLHKGERVMTAQENSAYKVNLTNYGKKSDESLVNEIKALRSELTQLRQEQADQTGKLIMSNYDANAQAATTVAEGVKQAAKTSSRKEAIKIGTV